MGKGLENTAERKQTPHINVSNVAQLKITRLSVAENPQCYGH